MSGSVILVPADFEIESVKKYDELNKKYKDSGIKVSEFYGSLNPSPFGVTKNPKNLKRVDFKTLQAYCEKLNEYGFQFNYILNFLCYGGKEFSIAGTQEILRYIKKLYEIGIRRFTVANPVVAQAIGLTFPDVHISISVVQNTSTALKLRTYSQIKGVDRVYISEDMIRDFSAIERLRTEAEKVGIELATLLNSFCLIDCPYKVNHANIDGHLVDDCKQDMQHYFYAWCSLQKLSHPKEILRLQSIRPEDISIYENCGVTAFKIAGRELKDADFLKTAEDYMKRKYEGNLMDLLAVYSDNFFREIYDIPNNKLEGRLLEMKQHQVCCRDYSNCDGCSICQKYQDAVQINEDAINRYRKIFTDSYNNFNEQVLNMVIE